METKINKSGGGEREVISGLQREIVRLREYIRNEGEITDTCTYDVLGEICVGCRCQRMGGDKHVLSAPAGSPHAVGSRRSFEEWISRPPYEYDLYRWPMDETEYAWPGQYRNIDVQRAWEAWQQAQND